MQRLCNMLRRQRLLKMLTQREVSELTGINISLYQKYEYGLILPKTINLMLLARHLEIDINILIKAREQEKNPVDVLKEKGIA